MPFIVNVCNKTSFDNYMVEYSKEKVLVTNSSSVKNFERFSAAKQYVIDKLQEQINELLDKRTTLMTLKQDDIMMNERN